MPILRAGNITDQGLDYDDLIYVPSARVSVLQRIRQGDVVIATSSGSLDVVGKAARAVDDFPGGFGAFCKVLRPTAAVEPRYFAHFFKTSNYRRRISPLAAGANINNLRNEHLDELLIPLPPLPEQQRIAEVLDRADALRAKRRETLALLDDLTRSVFMKMFGDFQQSRPGPLRPLADLCSIAGEYGAGVSSQPFQADLPRYIRITDIQSSGELSSTSVSPAGPASAWQRHLLEPGDVVFARSGATVGKTYLHPSGSGPCVFAGYLVRFRPDPAVLDPVFLMEYTKTPAYRSWVALRQNVVAQPNINAQQYGRELMIPTPPLELQRAFADMVGQINRQRSSLYQSSRALDGLFAVLQHRAFSGQL